MPPSRARPPGSTARGRPRGPQPRIPCRPRHDVHITWPKWLQNEKGRKKRNRWQRFNSPSPKTVILLGSYTKNEGHERMKVCKAEWNHLDFSSGEEASWGSRGRGSPRSPPHRCERHFPSARICSSSLETSTPVPPGKKLRTLGGEGGTHQSHMEFSIFSPHTICFGI